MLLHIGETFPCHFWTIAFTRAQNGKVEKKETFVTNPKLMQCNHIKFDDEVRKGKFLINISYSLRLNPKKMIFWGQTLSKRNQTFVQEAADHFFLYDQT